MINGKSINISADERCEKVEKECSMEIKEDLKIKIGDAEISSDSEKIIFKVGSVEVTIDSNGLTVQGGKMSIK